MKIIKKYDAFLLIESETKTDVYEVGRIKIFAQEASNHFIYDERGVQKFYFQYNGKDLTYPKDVNIASLKSIVFSKGFQVFFNINKEKKLESGSFYKKENNGVYLKISDNYTSLIKYTQDLLNELYNKSNKNLHKFLEMASQQILVDYKKQEPSSDDISDKDFNLDFGIVLNFELNKKSFDTYIKSKFVFSLIEKKSKTDIKKFIIKKYEQL